LGIINFVIEQLENNIDTPKGSEYLYRVVNCLPKGVLKKGSGILNTMLNNLGSVMPEMHLPGYNYCGPFTKLKEQLERGDKPINKLDEGCKKHDVFYRDHKETKERHIADDELANTANERIYANDASIGEKINAGLVKAAMNSKVFFGMGINRWEL